MLDRRARLGLGAALVIGAAGAVALFAPRPVPDEAPGPSSAELDARATREASAIAADVQGAWAELLRRGGRSYSESRIVPFRGAVRSECGWDERATAPFYCAADERVYVDLDFAGRLLAGPAPTGSQALAYVVAHAIGHHVQALTGVERRVRRDQRAEPGREEELARALELQADCFAGVWARTSGGRLLDEGGIAPALAAVADAAAARPAGAADAPPETWLHADRDTRIAWVRRGLAGGEPDACDPFSEIPRP